MEKFLIALDMDGTLLNKKREISFLTKQYLKKLTKQGHIIVLASGRPSRSLYRYYNELNLSTPMICYNGAYYFSPKDESLKPWAANFPKEIAIKAYKELKPYILNCMIENDTNIWIDEEDKYLANFFWYENMNLHKGDISEILDENPMSMICQIYRDRDDKEIISKIAEKYFPIKVRFWTGTNYFELYVDQTTKGSSLQKIADYYKIPNERIIAFGDAENDDEMLQISGYPVAMRNSKRPEIFKYAKIITKYDNNHNGIYHELKTLFKKIKK